MLIEMDSDERAFLLLIGHVQNEINSLNKVFTWCLNNSKSGKSSAEGLADGMQAMIYARLLAGKLCETWEVLRKYYFATKLSQRVDSKLPLESEKALTSLKLYFGKSNLIHQVRNSFAFHYSAEQFESNWEGAADEGDLSIILGRTIGNNLSIAGELVANRALLNHGDSKSLPDGFTKFFDDIHSISSCFTDFAEGVTIVILRSRMGENLESFAVEEEIASLLNYEDVCIPFFVNPVSRSNSNKGT